MRFLCLSRVCPGSPRCLFTGTSTSLNGVHAIGSRRHDQAMFGTSVARKTQQRGPFALQIFYTTPLNYPEAARYAPIRSE